MFLQAPGFQDETPKADALSKGTWPLGFQELTKDNCTHGVREASRCLVGESHVLRIAQLVQVRVAGQLDHRWGPTEQQ